ncbi:MAG TPA: hypothetical protein VK927_06245 [Adhaeribacter sp.]|nr:hypothetical protein [Adhaeribacter sp.]
MKSLFLACVFSLLALAGSAQKMVVEEKELTVNGMPRKGLQTTIQLDHKLVDKAWQSHLKDKAGKVQSSKGVYTIDRGSIESISATPLRIVSQVNASEAGTLVWWALDMGTALISKESTPGQYESAEAFMKDFAKKLYREDIARQVAEAEKVLASTANEEARTIKQADDIKRSIEKNKQRRAELEAELARNSQELVQLNQDVETNLKAQETARQNTENMKKAVEVVRNKIYLIE